MFPCDSNFSGAGPAGKVKFYLFFILAIDKDESDEDEESED